MIITATLPPRQHPGRPAKYKLDQLQPGQATEAGRYSNAAYRRTLAAIKRYREKKGGTFYARNVEGKLFIYRTA